MFGMPTREEINYIKMNFCRPRGCNHVKFKFYNNDFARVFLRYDNGIELAYLEKCDCGKYNANGVIKTNRR